MISAQPGPDTLQQLRRELSANGENAAIIAFTGEAEEAWSFAKLGDVSTRLAAGLVRRGISRGDSVALIAPNSPQWIVAFWAIIGAGAVAVPLDAQSDDHDLKRMIEISACRLAFSTTADAKRLQVIAPSCGTIILDRESDPATAESWRGLLGTTDTSLPTVTPTEPATIVFTSGTTGAPKAAPLSHANLLANVLALAALRIVGPGDRALLPLPLYHVYPLTIGMITPLAMGCGIVLPAGISGPEIVAASRRGRVTVLVGVPRLYTALLDNIRRGIVARPRTRSSANKNAPQIRMLGAAPRYKLAGQDPPNIGSPAVRTSSATSCERWRRRRCRSRGNARRNGLGDADGLRPRRNIINAELQSAGRCTPGIGRPSSARYAGEDCQSRRRWSWRNRGTRSVALCGLSQRSGKDERSIYSGWLVPDGRSRFYRPPGLPTHCGSQDRDDRARRWQEALSRRVRGRLWDRSTRSRDCPPRAKRCARRAGCA